MKTLPKNGFHGRGLVCKCGKYATWNRNEFRLHARSGHEYLENNFVSLVVECKDNVYPYEEVSGLTSRYVYGKVITE